MESPWCFKVLGVAELRFGDIVRGKTGQIGSVWLHVRRTNQR